MTNAALQNTTGDGRYFGYIPDLIRTLSAMLNFRFDLYTVPDGSYGYRKSAGRWTGMIGELLKEVAAKFLPVGPN